MHSAVLKEIRSLPAPARSRVKRFIDNLASVPIPAGATRLRGRQNAFRGRVGDYRIVYEVHVTEVVVYVFGVAHRREVYRRVIRRRPRN